MRRLAILYTLLTLLAGSFAAADENTPDAGQIRRRLIESVGHIPNVDEYSLRGQFTLRATGEDIVYNVSRLRTADRLAVDFVQENRTLNLRYVRSGESAWVASPEITADIATDRLPYIIQFDFRQLYGDLLNILEEGAVAPGFGIDKVDNEIYIRGKLSNGWDAVFVLNAFEYFPRKVRVHTTEMPVAAWMVPFVLPSGAVEWKSFPSPVTEFEIWLSDPVKAAGYRAARRMDFIENGGAVGSFILDESAEIHEELFDRPESLRIQFTPDTRNPAFSLFLDESELSARLKDHPWAAWSRENRLISWWGLWTFRMVNLSPNLMAPELFPGAALSIFLFFLYLATRRRKGKRFSWKLFISGAFIGCVIFAVGSVSGWMRRPIDRSLMTLHMAIRYAIAGNSLYADKVDELLFDFGNKAPAKNMRELGKSCQAYAFAYDIIRENLPQQRREQIEMELFHYARPLFGAANGWISNTAEGSDIAAGLGLVGLAIRFEPFIEASRNVMDRVLENQLSGGLHPAGAGPGSEAMTSASNLFYGLARANRADYYIREEFQNYVETTLRMLSPAGTLPLSGDTDMEHSRGLSLFFMKIASRMPDETGRRCVAARNRYWDVGRFNAAHGWARWIPSLFQSAWAYFDDPYVLLQYGNAITPSETEAAGAVFGGGQYAVLRAGNDPDALYLALNMLQPGSYGSRRDALSFDLYARRSLLLHGAGFPGRSSSLYGKTLRTSASNSITFNNKDQSENHGTGITSALLNQPLFDQVRAFADRVYDAGQVQRDIILVRPERNSPGYFIVLDDIFSVDPDTKIQWRIHGRGALAAGIDRKTIWTSTVFAPPKLNPDGVILEVSHPVGIKGQLSIAPETLYSRSSFLNQPAQSARIEFTGGGRFLAVMMPRKPHDMPVKIYPLGNSAFLVGETDWFSLGSLTQRVTVGMFSHISEYSLARKRGDAFPALLMVSGVECRFGDHELLGSKPLTASLDGLRGGLLTTRPYTQVEIRSPEIRPGAIFILDGDAIAAETPGALTFMLTAAGEHSLHPAN